MRNLEHFIAQEGRYKIGNGENFIIGRSRRMLEVYDLIERLADLSINILLSGETGTGKTLIAKALHYNSSVFRERPFVDVNCPGINQGIAESELFGHKKVAFTGASGDRT
ncbi:sigma 54-interacting transcriptional regulator, partial [Candidatus Woesearchaeota archaeon]|nr:sigma 54-interacting transcriptional regulator [Candidatus Woesearchaeota archaeon]